MNKEELKKHCEKQVERCSLLKDYKHQSEHQAVLDLIEENEQLKDNWNKLKEYLKGFDIEYLNEIMEHNLANTLESILDKMQELEKSDSNE